MYAVVETGGKQYKVTVGQTIEVEKLPAAVGDKVELDKVLMVSMDDGVKVGDPHVKGAKVQATVSMQDAYRKVVIFKYKNKTGYRRKTGHRQQFTRLRIDEIIL